MMITRNLKMPLDALQMLQDCLDRMTRAEGWTDDPELISMSADTIPVEWTRSAGASLRRNA
jgi:hypothetical protein